MIYKYNLDPRGTTILSLPLGSQVLSAGQTDNNLVVWADVTKEQETEHHVISTVFTGDEAPYNSTFLGTIVIGSLVHHVFIYNVQLS